MKDKEIQRELEFAWRRIPWVGLPLSFQVDFCQFLSREKPVVRSQILDSKFLDSLANSFKEIKCEFLYDSQGFFIVSRCKKLCHDALVLDHNPDPHEEPLGNLLGYPECCSKFIAQYGESTIDDLDNNFNKLQKNGDFKLIDISLYKEGISLLSHVPCSVECRASLELAKRIKSFILRYEDVRKFSVWAKKIKSHYHFNIFLLTFTLLLLNKSNF